MSDPTGRKAVCYAYTTWVSGFNGVKVSTTTYSCQNIPGDDDQSFFYGFQGASRQGGGGGPAGPAQQPGCPFTLSPLERRAGRAALRASFRAGAERVTAIVGGRVVAVAPVFADSMSATFAVPAGATFMAHGHLRFLGGRDHNYGSASEADSTTATRVGLPMVAYSVDSVSMVRPGSAIMTCGR